MFYAIFVLCFRLINSNFKLRVNLKSNYMKSIGEEIRRRFPRITMNLIFAFIFWLINAFVPPTLSNVMVPGLNRDAGFIIWIVTIIIFALFLIRALSDALVLGDIFADFVVKRLGIREGLSPKRAARDLAYIIVIILVATALSPILGTVENFGPALSTATTYIALALVIILIYDIGRIIYKIIEEKAEFLADHIARKVEKSGSDG